MLLREENVNDRTGLHGRCMDLPALGCYSLRAVRNIPQRHLSKAASMARQSGSFLVCEQCNSRPESLAQITALGRSEMVERLRAIEAGGSIRQTKRSVKGVGSLSKPGRVQANRTSGIVCCKLHEAGFAGAVPSMG